MASEKEIGKKLEKELDNILNDLEPTELEKVIQKLTEEYYFSYFSKNKSVNEASFKNLKKLVETYSSKFNVESYINYCLLLAVNGLLEKYVHNEINLKPLKVDLANKESDVTVNLLEKIKEKRRELRELEESNKKDVPEEDVEGVVN